MKKNKPKRYVSDNAQLISEWNWEKNTDFNPSQLTLGSNKKVWWKCNKEHEWQAIIANRAKGVGCPFCSNQIPIKGENDLQTVNPTLAKEWNYEKNNGLGPNDVLPNSGKKVWWKCSKGHEWQATIESRNRNCGCPYCSGRFAVKGKNDLQTINPKIAKEWNYEKNGELTPMDVLPNSNKKVWWKCKEMHEWKASIHGRNKGHNCPYCSGRYAVKSKNDLQTVNPKIAKEWNYEKNNELKPYFFSAGSGKKVWWKCSKGHEWQASISNRNKGRGCPYCSNKKVLKGYNDLQTINPVLSKEWNYEKNASLLPTNVLPNSGKKVWWKCSKGHEWQASIESRNKGNGCFICNSERHTSFPEYVLEYYFKKYGIDIIHSYKEKGFELDIYIPSKKIAIEYDGFYWHKSRTKKDLEKNRKCEKEGIKLYRIREGLLPLNDSSLDYIIQKDIKDSSTVFEEVLSKIVGTNVTIDLIRDSVAIENLRQHTEKELSLLFSNPKLAKEWNHEKNGNLKPENFATNSGKKVWWKCCNGHEWQATIDHRNKGTNCPYCSGKKVLKNYNDLQTINPELAKEWCYEKNNNLSPKSFTANSGKKVWWKCIKGHEWQATIASRNSGKGCPYCSGRYAIKGENDLQTVNYDLTKEWNYEKNTGLLPTDVLPNSSKKVWWKCSNGHEWQATIANRNKGNGCPRCTNKKLKP